MRGCSKLLIGVAALGMSACSTGDSAPLRCNCPASELGIAVPADRLADVKAVVATGVCSQVDAADGNVQFKVELLRAGTCHIAVTFQSGAPEFDADVLATQCTDGECCSICGPQAHAPLTVPETDGTAG